MKHGEASNRAGTRTRLYVIWCHMIERCENPNSWRYTDYGGRGIRVCDEWKDFVVFRDWAIQNGYSEKLSIDRLNNDGDYEPSNCKWSTLKEQANNKRNNRLLTYKGRTQTMTQWANEIGMNPGTFKYRIYLGWSVERAIEEPLRKWGA